MALDINDDNLSDIMDADFEAMDLTGEDAVDDAEAGDETAEEEADNAADEEEASEEEPEEESDDADAGEDAGDDTEAGEEETTEEEEEPEEKASDDETPPEVKEVRKNKDGKEEWVYEKKRGAAIYEKKQKYEALQSVVDGEDITPEQLKAALKSQQDMGDILLDFQSADPKDQASVFNHFIKLSRADRDSGALGYDPLPQAAEVFVDTISTQSPEAAAAISKKVMRQVIDETYVKAKRDGNKNLFAAAGNMDHAQFGTHKKYDEFEAPPETPAAGDRKPAENGAATAEEISKISDALRASVTKRTSAAIDAGLKPHAEAYEKFPERLKSIRARLGDEIKTAIKQDADFRKANEPLLVRATRASSEEVRNGLLGQIVSRYEAKAKKVVASMLPKIVSEDAAHLEKVSSDQKRRLTAAQSKKKTPSGLPAKAKLPETPKGNAKVAREDWENFLDSAFSS